MRVALTVVAILTGGLCVGQEPSPNYEHLKELEPFVGEWKVEGAVNNQAVSLWMHCKWMSGKGFLIQKLTPERNSTDFGWMRVVGWDSGKQKVTSYEFYGGGGQAKSIHTKSDKGWIVEKTRTTQGGTTIDQRIDITFSADKNAYRAEGKWGALEAKRIQSE